MTETSSLDEQALEFERRPSTCTVCAFIEARPADKQPEWDALLAGPRKHTAVLRLLRRYGFVPKSDSPIVNHRSSGHRK